MCDGDIAFTAKKPSHIPCIMAVVNAKTLSTSSGLVSSAYRAEPSLFREHLVVRAYRQSVVLFDAVIGRAVGIVGPPSLCSSSGFVHVCASPFIMESQFAWAASLCQSVMGSGLAVKGLFGLRLLASLAAFHARRIGNSWRPCSDLANTRLTVRGEPIGTGLVAIEIGDDLGLAARFAELFGFLFHLESLPQVSFR